MATFSLPKMLKRRKPSIRVPLEVLSKIWVEKKQPPSKSSIAQVIIESSVDDKLKKFAQKHSRHFEGVDETYFPVFKDLIEFMEKKGEPIREHSLAVAEKTLEILKTGGNATLYPKAIIAALAHDIGEIEKPLNEGEHIMQSSSYISKLLEKHEIKDKTITAAVAQHHVEDKHLKKDNLVAVALNYAERELTPVEPVKPSEPVIESPVETPKQEKNVFLPPGVSEPATPEITITKQEFLQAVASKIDPMQFECFCFLPNIYIRHKSVKNILFGETAEIEKNTVDEHIVRICGVTSNRYRLQFKNGKMNKNWYFSLPLAMFDGIEITEEQKTLPRDIEGRWMTGITMIKEGEPLD